MSDDRDSWCTPAYLAAAIGRVDLDPCSNDRSHVQANRRFCGGPDDDGLALASTVPASARTFLNTPYSRGQVIRWVRAYEHTDWMFLVRLDPSTEWWAALMAHRPALWMPDERISFEPPPGVKASTNPFPHCILARREIPPGLWAHGYLWQPAPPMQLGLLGEAA
jgi:hypothetical protein